MEAIRTIQNVDQGEIRLALPESFWGKEVEIIVLSTETTESMAANGRHGLRGALKQHAPPERLRLGTALSELGRRIGLTDEDITAIEQARDRTPAEPERFE